MKTLSSTIVLFIAAQAFSAVGPTVSGRVDPDAPTNIGKKSPYTSESEQNAQLDERERARREELQRRILRERETRARNQMEPLNYEVDGTSE